MCLVTEHIGTPDLPASQKKVDFTASTGPPFTWEKLASNFVLTASFLPGLPTGLPMC